MHGMKLGWGLALALVACGDSGGSTAGQTDSNGGTETDGATSQGSAPTSGDSQSGSTGSNSGVSDSHDDETAAPTSEVATITASDSDPSTSTSATSQTTVTTQDTGDTSADDTTNTTSTSSPISASDSDTSTGGTSTTAGDSASTGGDESSTTEPECVPTEEICNDLDDDCDNIIDDVDVGGDGVCDCLSIALIGDEGANPSSEFQIYLEDLGTTVVRLNSSVLNDYNMPLTPDVIKPYDIMILDYLKRSYTAQEAADVRTWIEAGGGLMSMTGHTNAQFIADNPNSILSTVGLTYNTSAGFFSGPVTQFAVHPINEGLTSVSFYGGLFINITEDGVGVNKTIMTLPQGPVGVVQERVMGRVFVFGDEWVEFDSEWKNIPQIKQFWQQTLTWLGPQDSCTVPQ